MPRNMSFALTTKQFKDKTKTVTRRFGWWFLKPGDVVMGVEKGMGLKKGEKIKKLGLIRVLSARKEPLCFVTVEDCAKEGFPNMEPIDFVDMLRRHYGPKIADLELVNRIEFEYINGK